MGKSGLRINLQEIDQNVIEGISTKEEILKKTAFTSLARQGSEAIFAAFLEYHTLFQEITHRAGQRFERRDWHGMQSDALERLDLYALVIGKVVEVIQTLLADQLKNRAFWMEMKHRYSETITGHNEIELAETFFNSVTRRIFSTVGVDPEIEYVASDFDTLPLSTKEPVFETLAPGASMRDLVRVILAGTPFAACFENLEGEVARVAPVIEAALERSGGLPAVEKVEILRPVFYRLKGAYLIGRMRAPGGTLPFVFCLCNRENGIRVDAVLLTEDEISILFSFTRSYFHVEAERAHNLVAFLKSVMPLKRVAELYISIGHHKHGKTELFRDLLRHLTCSTDQFVSARGEKGMVMVVFTMPSYDMVFKVIRDRFAEPKNTTRQTVMERYGLVFHRDRAGRLVDAQEFEHLRFEKACFSPELLQELLEGAPSSVTVVGKWVAIRHVYTERRLTPLDIYLKEAAPQDALEAVADYGHAIKDLAATNIFPGDILLKNFGVTRHGRVVFYDYDELCLLTDCRFRRIPQARDYLDDFQAEPWFYVGKNDIFPEEFRTFLGLQGELRETFVRLHTDLFGVEYWRAMQARHKAGEVVEILPYRESRRLNHDESALA